MTRTTITLHLRLPDKANHPNSSPHRFVRARARKRDRSYAYIMALAAKGAGTFNWEYATMRATFYLHRDDHDDDNLAAWLKAFRDGIADAGIVANDRGITMLPIVREKSVVKNHQGVTIVIEQIDYERQGTP